MSDPAQPSAATAADLIAGVSTETPSPPPAPSPAGDPPLTPPPPAAPTVPAGEFADERDDINRPFHSAKFRLKDGKPQRDARGWFVPLGLGAPGKEKIGDAPAPSGAAVKSSLPPDDAAGGAPVDLAAEFGVEMGVETCLGLVQAAFIMVGDDEGVLTPMEEKMLRGPLGRILAKYNLTSKMTPELETAAIIALLFLRRLKQPKTQTWFQSKLAGLRGWWIARKVAKASPAAA